MGNLWIGTQSGISRFNSKTFVNFSMDDGLADNVISQVIIDDSSRLWAITSSGISRYDNGGFISYYFAENQRVNDVISIGEQLILATNTALISFDGSQFKTLFSSDKLTLKIRALELLEDGSLICGTNEGLFILKDKKLNTFPLHNLTDLNISDIKLRGPHLILSTFNAGIFLYNLQSDLYIQYTVQGIPVRSLYVDEVSIWAASNFGVIEIRNEKESYFTEDNGLSINSIKTVFKDIEGNLWIGTYGKGLLKFLGTAVTSYTAQDGLSSDIIMAISEYKNGSFAFGSYDKGLTIDNKNGAYLIYNNDNGLIHNSVWATFIDDEDRCWVGTTSGLQCFKNGRFIELAITKQVNSKIRNIVAHQGNIYFAGVAGLWRLKNGELTQINIGKSIDINKVDFTSDRIVLATREGLYCQYLDSINEPFMEINLKESNINSVAVDQFDNIWAGTINGLYIIMPTLKARLFELDRNNYKSKNVMGIIRDRYDRMWVSTTHGLFMAVSKNPFVGPIVLNQYTLSEGLIDMESNLNALFEDSEGKIWLGTSSALVRINPRLNPVLFSYSLPKLSVTGLRLFKEPFNYANYDIGELMLTGVPKSITLPHTKNHLTFDFIGVNNKNPEKVYYTYRLLGAEDKWSSLTQENNASYSFISPGTYEFQVKSANKNLEWTEPVVVSITITPPYWQRWWFITLVVLAIIGLIYLFFYVRIAGVKQKKDNERLVSENKLRNLEQQSLNASMNRHFIFNSLNSIQYFINSSDKRSANKYLSSFAKLIRKNLDSSTQANFLVALNEEIERIELYLTLEKMRFNEKFDYMLKIDPDIDTEMIQVPSMILQPFVENSIIHGVLPKSEKGIITIEIREEHNCIVFEVIDNGVGIDSSLKTKDVAEGDHKSQGMEITANRIDLLREINGDQLMIIGPFQINENGVSTGTKVIIKLPIY